MPSAAQPTVGQNGARLRPKCQGLGGAVKEANRIAAPTRATLCSSVAITVKAALLLPLPAWPVAAARMPTVMNVITSPTPKAAGAFQAGQRGWGSAPSGSSGRSGGGSVTVVFTGSEYGGQLGQRSDGLDAGRRVAVTGQQQRPDPGRPRPLDVVLERVADVHG